MFAQQSRSRRAAFVWGPGPAGLSLPFLCPEPPGAPTLELSRQQSAGGSSAGPAPRAAAEQAARGGRELRSAAPRCVGKTLLLTPRSRGGLAPEQSMARGPLCTRAGHGAVAAVQGGSGARLAGARRPCLVTGCLRSGPSADTPCAASPGLQRASSASWLGLCSAPCLPCRAWAGPGTAKALRSPRGSRGCAPDRHGHRPRCPLPMALGSAHGLARLAHRWDVTGRGPLLRAAGARDKANGHKSPWVRTPVQGGRDRPRKFTGSHAQHGPGTPASLPTAPQSDHSCHPMWKV